MTVEVELADGTVLELPAGTTPEQAQRAAKAYMAKAGTLGAATPQNAPPAASEGYARAGDKGPFMAGVADSAIRGYLGLKQFAGGLLKEEQGVLAAMKDEQDHDPNWAKRTAGNVAGTAGAMLAPGIGWTRAGGGAVPMLAKTIASKTGRLSAPAAAAGVSGVQGLALNPGEGEGFGEQMVDKVKQSGVDAAVGAGLGSVGRLFKKTITKPFTPTAEAVQLMNQNVNPTLQQGAEGWLGRRIGGLASGTAKVADRQNREVIDEYVRRTMPGLDPSDMTVPELIRMMELNFRGAPGGALGEYGRLYDGKIFPLTNQSRSAIWNEARGPRGTQPMATQMATHAMTGTGTALNVQNNVRMRAAKMTEYRNLLQDAINGFNGDTGVMSKQARANLINARKKYDELVRDPALTPDERALLADIDTRYGDFMAFAEAGKNASFHMKPRAFDLLQAKKKMDKTELGFATARDDTQRELLEPAIRTMGATPTQDMERAALASVKRSLPAAVLDRGVDALMSPAYPISMVGQSAKGARILFGETKKQKEMARMMNQIAPYLAGSGNTLTPE